jgi:hypothetical protein
MSSVFGLQRRVTHTLRLTLVFMVLMGHSACGAKTPAQVSPTPSKATATEESMIPSPTSVVPSTVESITTRAYVSPVDGFTHLRVDGDDQDWSTYPAVITDPMGDSGGALDLTTMFAVRNDTFLYVMLVFEGGNYIGYRDTSDL